MRFLTTFQLWDFSDTIISLLTAFILGTLIGAERQYSDAARRPRDLERADGRVGRLNKNPGPRSGIFFGEAYQPTNTFLNCQGSLVSMSSGNRPGRPLSGVQSV